MKIRRLHLGYILLLILHSGLTAQQKDSDFYFRGALYFDWYGSAIEDTDFYNQLSSRFKLDLINRRGSGWNLKFDLRDRMRLSEKSTNQVILYDARINFEKPQSPWFVSLGQMNLYDTAGIGQLLGGIVGFKPFSDLLIGGYAGLESSVYIKRTDGDYRKFGAFARWLGARGKRLSLSYNHLRYEGIDERRYLYAGGLFPLGKIFTLYGNMEYELASHVKSEDRLSRVFVNARIDPIPFADITAHYSSGRGLDFHRYAIESSQNPTLNDRELEHFYYTRQYGLRLSLKPARGIRLFAARQESEQKDDNVRNHTWRFGASAVNIFKAGLSVYGNYAANRGEISESDAYYLSVTKDLGRLTWNVSFSNTFNGVRFDSREGTPRIIHLDAYKTIATDVFIAISRELAASLEYEYFIQKESHQHLFFIRLILRK